MPTIAQGNDVIDLGGKAHTATLLAVHAQRVAPEHALAYGLQGTAAYAVWFHVERTKCKRPQLSGLDVGGFALFGLASDQYHDAIAVHDLSALIGVVRGRT